MFSNFCYLCDIVFHLLLSFNFFSLNDEKYFTVNAFVSHFSHFWFPPSLSLSFSQTHTHTLTLGFVTDGQCNNNSNSNNNNNNNSPKSYCVRKAIGSKTEDVCFFTGCLKNMLKIEKSKWYSNITLKLENYNLFIKSWICWWDSLTNSISNEEIINPIKSFQKVKIPISFYPHAVECTIILLCLASGIAQWRWKRKKRCVC